MNTKRFHDCSPENLGRSKRVFRPNAKELVKDDIYSKCMKHIWAKIRMGHPACAHVTE